MILATRPRQRWLCPTKHQHDHWERNFLSTKDLYVPRILWLIQNGWLSDACRGHHSDQYLKMGTSKEMGGTCCKQIWKKEKRRLRGRQPWNHIYRVKLRNMPNYKCILDLIVTKSKRWGKGLTHHYPISEVAAIQKTKCLMVQEPPPFLSNYLTELSSIGTKT